MVPPSPSNSSTLFAAKNPPTPSPHHALAHVPKFSYPKNLPTPLRIPLLSLSGCGSNSTNDRRPLSYATHRALRVLRVLRVSNSEFRHTRCGLGAVRITPPCSSPSSFPRSSVSLCLRVCSVVQPRFPDSHVSLFPPYSRLPLSPPPPPSHPFSSRPRPSHPPRQRPAQFLFRPRNPRLHRLHGSAYGHRDFRLRHLLVFK